MKTGIEMIAEERQRQVDAKGWTSEHDDTHLQELHSNSDRKLKS